MLKQLIKLSESKDLLSEFGREATPEELSKIKNAFGQGKKSP